MNLAAVPGAFQPVSDAWMLTRAIRAEPHLDGARTLDLCTGTGVAAIAASSRGAYATAVDVSRRALLATWINAHRQRCPVDVRRGHLFEPVGDDRFDLVTANPPYVPSPDPDLPTRGPSRAWAGGPDGRAVLDQICDQARRHLRPGGAVLLVHSDLIGEEETLERLARTGLLPSIVDRRRGPLGPLMRAQQATGLVPATVDEEDLVVVRAVRPYDRARRVVLG